MAAAGAAAASRARAAGGARADRLARTGGGSTAAVVAPAGAGEIAASAQPAPSAVGRGPGPAEVAAVVAAAAVSGRAAPAAVSGRPGPAAVVAVGGRAGPAYWRWRAGPTPPGRTVVFDLDGVLSDAASRQHYLEGGRRDWDGFFEACGDDPLIDEVARVLELLAPDLRIVLLTGRPMRVQPQTLAWLDRYQLRWDLLIMRPSGDYAAARSFKRRSIAELREYGMHLELGFEDDRRNLEMFRAEGVPCLYVHSGYYD